MSYSKVRFLAIVAFCFSLTATDLHSEYRCEVDCVTVDTLDTNAMNMDATYSRPFFLGVNGSLAVGGYIESNVEVTNENGVISGPDFQMKRFTVFVASEINEKIRFLSELEYENGTREINVEFAAVDLQINELINVRAGIILNPIGSFNQNHDGPKWMFTNRPIVSTDILPATLSNVGVGVYGKYRLPSTSFGYELYLSNGFDGRIIDNEFGRTRLASVKDNPDRFAENPTSVPLVTGKIATRNTLGEFGISTMIGLYTPQLEEGLIVDTERWLYVVCVDFAVDVNSMWPKVNGEIAFASVEIPAGLVPLYGSRQIGGFMDIVQDVANLHALGFENARLSVAIRLEYVDWNFGNDAQTGMPIGDEQRSLGLSLALRPSELTVIRSNYTLRKATDLLRNDLGIVTVFSLGISTYF